MFFCEGCHWVARFDRIVCHICPYLTSFLACATSCGMHCNKYIFNLVACKCFCCLYIYFECTLQVVLTRIWWLDWCFRGQRTNNEPKQVCKLLLCCKRMVKYIAIPVSIIFLHMPQAFRGHIVDFWFALWLLLTGVFRGQRTNNEPKQVCKLLLCCKWMVNYIAIPVSINFFCT